MTNPAHEFKESLAEICKLSGIGMCPGCGLTPEGLENLLDTHSAHLVKRIEALMEQLAEIEHDRWSRWQEWCHKVLRENCPSPELEKVLERWDRQIATPYLELSEAEKESDREQVRPYLELITKTISDQAIDIVKGTQRN